MNRIVVIGMNTWKGLVRKKAVFVLIALVSLTLILPVVVQFQLAGNAGADFAGVILNYEKFFLFLSLFVGILYAAGIVEAEITQRTLASVMVRPICRAEYLLGRASAVLMFFVILVWSGGLFGYGLAFWTGASLADTFLLGLLQRLCEGAGIITVAVALGALFPASTVVTVIVGLYVMTHLLARVPADLSPLLYGMRIGLHFVTPCGWQADLLSGSSDSVGGWRAMAVMAENIGYGATIFAICSWIFSKKDLPLRER